MGRDSAETLDSNQRHVALRVRFNVQDESLIRRGSRRTSMFNGGCILGVVHGRLRPVSFGSAASLFLGNVQLYVLSEDGPALFRGDTKKANITDAECVTWQLAVKGSEGGQRYPAVTLWQPAAPAGKHTHTHTLISIFEDFPSTSIHFHSSAQPKPNPDFAVKLKTSS